MAVLARNRDRPAQLRSQIELVEAAVVEDRRAANTSYAMATEIETGVSELAEQEATGQISREEVDRRLADAERAAAAARRNAAARIRAAEIRERDLERLRSNLAAAKASLRLAELEAAYKAQSEASGKAQRAITAALGAAGRLVVAREAAADLERRLRMELDGVDVEWPDAPDEAIEADELTGGSVIPGNDLIGDVVDSVPGVLVVRSAHAGLVNVARARSGLTALLDLLASG